MSEPSITGSFARRLAYLRGILASDPAAAGDQGLKLLEEYLEHLALGAGYTDDQGGIGRYVNWLRRGGPLSDALLDRVESYAQVRNCLAHSYGLQTGPDLAAEVVEFLGGLISERRAGASRLMSSDVRSVDEQSLLRAARDLMLQSGFGRLAVLRGRQVVALLIERDIVAAEADADRRTGRIDGLRVGEALPPQASRRIAVVAAEADADSVISALRRPGVEAVIVTRDGQRHQAPLGIITAADVLYRM